MIRRTMRSSLPVVLLLGAALAVPSMGCKRLAERAAEKAEEKAIEKQTGGQVSINGEKGTLTIVTDAGAMTLGETAKIPDDFPKNVPVYPGAAPKVAMKSAAGGKETWSVIVETMDAKDKVVAYYKANMSGFTVASTMDVGTGTMTVYQSPKLDVTLMTGAESGGKTSITLSVTSK
jgi:hypothetical protein